MSKVPEMKPFKSSAKSTTIVCWKPGTTEAEKQQDLAELEKYMAYRIARAKKKPNQSNHISTEKEST